MRGTPLERFFTKVTTGVGPCDCWRWRASLNRQGGYGQFWLRGRLRVAHHVAYILLVGPLPKWKRSSESDHLCRHRWCVNPWHLEFVTGQTNVLRGALPRIVRRRHAAITQCPQGHAYSPDNTYRARIVRPATGTKLARTYHVRQCRTCHRNRQQKSRVDARE
jgi:hypothetical protein